jgi:hypothetical protein
MESVEIMGDHDPALQSESSQDGADSLPRQAEMHSQNISEINASLGNSPYISYNKQESPDNQPSALSRHEEIQYRYLTFETEVPIPHAPCLPGESKEVWPEPPNLQPFISPLLWSNPRKALIMCLACFYTGLTAVAAGCYAPPEALLTAEWNVSPVAYNVGITVYCIGYGISPMVLAPFSEINGRRPVFFCSGLLFTGMVSDPLRTLRLGCL